MKQLVNKSRAVANNVCEGRDVFSLIVDGNNLLKMSLVDKTMNNEGKEYGAVMSFLRMLGSVLLKKDFDYCMVCWDGIGSGVLRWEYYKDYKLNRGKNYELHDPNMSDYYKKFIDFEKKVIAHSRETYQQANVIENDDEVFEREREL